MARASTSDIEISVDGYATMAQIQGLIPWRTIDTSSTPTRVQSLNMARDLFQDVNILLSTLGYKIPVASGNGTTIRFLGRLHALGTAAQIEDAIYSAGNVESSAYADRLRKRYDQTYKMLEKGDLSLNASLTSNYLTNRTQKAAAYSFHDISGTEQETVFTKNMDF